jgi:hypothetical protein
LHHTEELRPSVILFFHPLELPTSGSSGQVSCEVWGLQVNWDKLKAQGMLLAHVLTSSEKTKEEKLEVLTDLNVEVIEIADDIVQVLPFGFGPLAKQLVDNPPADAWEREMLAKPLAELEYQAYDTLVKTCQSVGASLEAEIKALADRFGLVLPALA